VRVEKRVRLVHKRPAIRARLRQPEPGRERAPALAPSQSNWFVNKPSHSLLGGLIHFPHARRASLRGDSSREFRFGSRISFHYRTAAGQLTSGKLAARYVTASRASGLECAILGKERLLLRRKRVSPLNLACLAQLSCVQVCDEAVELFIGVHEHFQQVCRDTLHPFARLILKSYGVARV